MNDHLSPDTVFRTSLLEENDGPGHNPTDNRTMGEIIAARFSRRGFLRVRWPSRPSPPPSSPIALITADKARAAAGAPPSPSTKSRPASTTSIMSPRAMTPTCCCAGATRCLPMRRSSIRPSRRPRPRRRQFGYNNDYVGYIPLDGSAEHGLLVVNHEYTNPHLMFPGIVKIVEKDGKKAIEVAPLTKEQVDVEMAAHGGTIVEIRKDGGKWQVVRDGKLNRRITANTEMQIDRPGRRHTTGCKTNADPTGTQGLRHVNNCAGGVTPWGTYVMAEENIHGYFSGELPADHQGSRQLQAPRHSRGRLRLGDVLRSLRSRQGAERAQPLRLDRRGRRQRSDLDAEEAHRARPLQA